MLSASSLTADPLSRLFTAFEFTADAVRTVLQQMEAPPCAACVHTLFDRLDACRVEKAALCGCDIEEQTELAHREPQRQLTATFGIAGADRDWRKS